MQQFVSPEKDDHETHSQNDYETDISVRDQDQTGEYREYGRNEKDWDKWSGNNTLEIVDGEKFLYDHDYDATGETIMVPFKPIFWQQLGPLVHVMDLIDELKKERHQRSNLRVESLEGSTLESLRAAKTISFFDFIKGFRIMHTLDDADISYLQGKCQPVYLQDMDMIIESGKSTSHLFLVLSGCVRVSPGEDEAMAAASTAVNYFELTKGDIFGSVALTGSASVSNYFAVGQVFLLAIPPKVARKFQERDNDRCLLLEQYRCVDGGLSSLTETFSMTQEEASLYTFVDQTVELLFAVGKHNEVFMSIHVYFQLHLRCNACHHGILVLIIDIANWHLFDYIVVFPTDEIFLIFII